MDQSQDNLAGVPDGSILLCRKSWVAYLRAILRLFLFTAIAIVGVYFKPEYWHYFLLVLLIPLTLVGYEIWLLRSYKLYYDSVGVWLYSGVLPWKRGVSGVKWRDLDEAIFVNSFFSWITNSYTVQLRHRFTKEIEISAESMANGKQVAIQINQQQRQRLSTADANLPAE